MSLKPSNTLKQKRQNEIHGTFSAANHHRARACVLWFDHGLGSGQSNSIWAPGLFGLAAGAAVAWEYI